MSSSSSIANSVTASLAGPSAKGKAKEDQPPNTRPYFLGFNKMHITRWDSRVFANSRSNGGGSNPYPSVEEVGDCDAEY